MSSLPKTGLPPELADAIEFTAEFRRAMGLVEGGPPSEEELAQIPEWHAARGWITAEEYLACFGYSPQAIQTIPHQNTGKNNRWKNKQGMPRKSLIVKV